MADEAASDRQQAALTTTRAPVGFVEAVRDQADWYVAQRKGDVAGMIADIGHGIRRAGDGLGAQPHIKALVDNAAAGMADLSAAIAERDFGEIAADLAAEARRRPLATAALIGAAGFALAWLVRSAGVRSGTGTVLATRSEER